MAATLPLQLAHLLGEPVPGEPWVQGAVRPVKTLDTRVALGREVPLEPDPDGLLRAVLGDTVVSVTYRMTCLLSR